MRRTPSPTVPSRRPSRLRLRGAVVAGAVLALLAAPLPAVAAGPVGAAAPLAAAGVVRAASTAPGPGTYEENSSAIRYSGSWSSLSSSGSSGGGIRYATASSASASLTFSGSWITWYTWKSANAGIIRVLIDGEEVARVDNYARSSTTGVVGYSAPVEPGEHTITIVGSGSKNSSSGGRMTHLDSFVVTDAAPPAAAADAPRATDCPAATTTVSTASQLTSALRTAGPGTVIRLADGSYTGTFLLNASGTAERPIWLCGSPWAVLTTGDVNSGSALRIEGAKNVVVTGFTVARSLQGVMVKGSSSLAVTDLVVKDLGYEGIHLYAFTTDSIVAHNLISRTGSADVAYGEGVYIGTSQRRWSEVTQGRPDASDRNVIVANTIKNTGAEGIEAKEGTSDGLIADNVFEGFQPGSRSLGWVLVTGNDWSVTGNTGTSAVQHAYSSMAWEDWGWNNEFRANTGTADASGYGVWVHDRSRGVSVSCDNVVDGAASGGTNVYCGP